MNNEIENTWTIVVVAYLNVLSQNLFGKPEESNEIC
jgi:hypothetical protein